MIEKKSLKALGRDYKISPHFTLKEMACKDGSDLVLYSTELLAKLEELRAYVGGSVTITSGYRTAAYNASMKPPGAKNSQHIKGTAADIIVRRDGKVIPAKLICCLCQSLGFRGIGYISANATHVDMRTSGSYRGDERKGYGGNVGGDFYKYFGVKKSQIDALKAVLPTPKTNADKAPGTEKSKKAEDEKVYKDVSEVPSHYKESAKLRIEYGATDGECLQESLVRGWTVDDRMDLFVRNLNDVPSWARADIELLIKAGIIRGDGKNPIGLRLSDLRLCIMSMRISRAIAKGLI